MYGKLAIRNAKKSVKDYIIYILTLTICVGLFYAFLSVCSSYYVSSLPVEYNLEMLQQYMRVPVIGITGLLIFLIQYVNNYMLRRKQKEFAIQTLLGMEQKHTALLFFAETLMMGLISIVIGILLGVFFSQVLTMHIMNFFEEEYRLHFSLYLDTFTITVIGFLSTFLLIGGLNIWKIKKLKIIDMLRAEKELQNDLKKDYLMPVLILIGGAASLQRVIDIVDLHRKYKEAITGGAMAPPDILLFYANLLLPALFVITVLAFLMACVSKRRLLSLKKPVILLTGLAALLVICNLLIVAGHPAFDSSTTNRAYVFVMVYLVFLLFTVFYALSALMQVFKEKSKKLKYRGNILFITGQLNARLSSNFRTMSILAAAILLAVTTFIIDPILSGWALGYLKERAVFDIQISTEANSHTTYETLPKGDFSYADNYFKEQEIERKSFCKADFFYIKREDFKAGNMNMEQPDMVMPLSQYNKLLTMAGLKTIDLKDTEFTMQWQYSVVEEEVKKFLEKNETITINKKVLSQADEMRHRARLGEVIYPYYNGRVIIVPDDICEGLLLGKSNYYAMTQEKLSFEAAQKVNSELKSIINSQEEKEQYATALRLRTLQRNEGISGALVFKLLLFYGGIVLFVISFAVLSLQQLADSSEFKQRFQIIKKLGVEERSINRIICWQMGLWFGLPIFTAGISALITGNFYIKWMNLIIETLIGRKDFLESLTEMLLIILVLLGCYFISTWILFKKNIEAD
ncbi:FtsX-like permease family protein [Anaerocolumna sp. AGMB13020]|uniref:FtsX-like permease family protein n=1 Tax=Anaerocolumna sp. AGMB13020 TaxID=3081750 RepID=UPI002954C708|nr:FtsX-like permease family protein [Anaerocolumna sp. AGMB13020]WOO38743.1 FtsX-like permease family protein [Anaerocolumna sp. AGMB13020]